MALNLATLTEYKAYAGISSTNFDSEITSLLPRVSQLVKSYCRRSFVDYADEARTEVYNGGTGALILTETPVLQVQALEFSTDYGQTYVPLLEFVDWYLDDICIRPINVREWPLTARGYRVTYTAGYEVLPADVKLAVLDLITYYRQNDSAVHSNKAPGTNSVQIEYVSTTSLPAHIKRILDMYMADYT